MTCATLLWRMRATTPPTVTPTEFSMLASSSTALANSAYFISRAGRLPDPGMSKATELGCSSQAASK
eukprot:CAMPEP_0170633882 /NCGR_PEP_ID=MMETSP0224-20130122/36263_1 /TAXON_ID=285029 /ORGANISM="Togula jolla, Strain CCCM 725" /LENGTH=66 /DNA_ID=CAMNT_0010963021 /DNA_START=99 /DNA_END=296 /DNA_ORIENTATION=-